MLRTSKKTKDLEFKRAKANKPKSEPEPEPAPEDSLAHLDDTKLPEGSEEYVLPGLDLLTESDEISYDEQTEEVKEESQGARANFCQLWFQYQSG